MKRVCLFAAFTLLCFTNLIAQTQTVGLFTRVVGSYDSGYILFPPVQNSDTTYLIDRCGKLVHKWPSSYTAGADAYLQQDGSILRSGHYPNAIFDSCNCGIGGIIERIDWSGNVVWHYIISDNVQVHNHDIWPMANGNILVDVWEIIDTTEALAKGRNPSLLGNRIYSPKVMEIKPIGTDSAEVVWQWRLWDHIVQDYDTKKPNYGTVKDHPELVNVNYINLAVSTPKNPNWTHFNSVAYNEERDEILLSFHHFNEICIIDHSTTTAQAASHTGGTHNKGGDILYRWGNPAVYNSGTATDVKLFQQHDPEWILHGKYKGQIMVFNNGLGRPGGSLGTSVDIIDPLDSLGGYSLLADGTYGPVAPSWTYPSAISPSFYSTVMGSAQVLPNGNILIDNATSGKFFEIDSTDNIVWQYVNPVSNGAPVAQYSSVPMNFVYRCYFYPATYPAFASHIPYSGDPIESDPIPVDCDTTVVGPDNVPAVTQQKNILVFPNPATNSITVQVFGKLAIKKLIVSDITGRVLQVVVNPTQKQHIDVSGLAVGVYLLQSEDTNGLLDQIKFVKQ